MPCQMSTVQIFDDIVLLPIRDDRQACDDVMKEVLPGPMKECDKRQGCQDNPFSMLPALSPYPNSLQVARRRALNVTESQNHRMLGFGRHLCGSSSPTPLLKQGHLEQAVQDLVQVGLAHLQRRRLHSLPGQPVPVLRHPQREEVLPHVQTELLMLQFVPIAPCPVAGHH